MCRTLFYGISKFVVLHTEPVLPHLLIGIVEAPVVARDAPDANHAAGSV